MHLSVFAGLPGVLFVLPDSYVDAENKDYGGTCYYQFYDFLHLDCYIWYLTFVIQMWKS